MSAQIGFHDLTSDGLVITAQQKRFYEREGYLVIKKVLSQHDIDIFTNRFKEICQMKDVPATMTVMRDFAINRSEYVPGEKAIMKLQDFGDDPVLFSFCQHPEIVSIVRDLIGTRNANLLAMHTMLINKPPDTGSQLSRHPLHQDQQYFPFGPSDAIVCAWTAMETVNRANGCLVVVPGTHKGPVHPHEYPKWEGGVNPLYHGIQDFDPNMPRLHLEMQAGDTVFFHPILIHGSGTNRTTGFRKAISCHFANDDVCRYQPITQGQSNTANEIVDTAQRVLKKFGIDDADAKEAIPDLEGVWRMKAKAVSGVRNHL